jgi:hypothetical protein
MSLCPPGRDDSALVVRLVGIDHCKLNAVYDTHCIDPDLAIFETIVDPFESGALKDPVVVQFENLRS